MAKAFNLPANIVLSGPTNIKPVVAQIRRQIGSINANVQLKFDPRAGRNAAALAQNIDRLNTSLNALTTTAIKTQSAVNNLSNSFSNFQRVNSNTISSLNNASKSVNKINNSAAAASQSFNKFGKEAALAVKRFAAYSIVTAGIFGFINAIRKGVDEAIDFQNELVRIGQVTGKSTDQLKGLSAEVGRLSTELGVSSKELINVAQILAQAGLSANDTKIALESLAKSTLAPTFKAIENTTEGAIAAMAQFKIQSKDLESVLGSVNSVSAAFAVESEDLISVIRRAGGAFAASSSGIGNFATESERGVRQLQELSALFTSVRATTRESADSIATGLRTIFTRVQRGSTIEFLKQFNIQLEEGGKFVGQFEAFKRLSEGLKDLDTRDVRFSQIIEELGGFRQVSKVIPLLKNFEVAQNALNVAIQGQGSLTQDAARAQESIQVQINKTRERFLELIRDISNTTTFQTITKGVLSLANGFITLGEYLKPVIPLLTTLFALKGFQALRQFTGGFIGAFKGVSAQQLGQNTGGALGGNNPASANVNLITTQNNLRTAILANTTAINQLNNYLLARRGGSPKFGPGFAEGGKVHKFARGGIVPGSGDRDTVPAMLMPGEFVVRKKAVEAIGSEKLFAANRLAEGGLPDPKALFKAKRQAKKVAQAKEQAAIDKKLKSDKIPTFGVVSLFPGDKNIDRISTVQTGKFRNGKKRTASYRLITASLSKKEQSDNFEASLVPIIQNALNIAASNLGQSLGVSTLDKNIGVIPNKSAIMGSFFEGALVRLGAPYDRKDIEDDQRPFDFPKGLGSNLAQKFNSPALADIPVDAKRNFSTSTKSINNKVRTALKLKGFASGGSVGTDTVPAMLTPGEFVLRKEAAQKLGRSTLNDLNNADRVQKFANGGFVQKFADGGSPVSISSFSGRSQLRIVDEITNYLTKLKIPLSEQTKILKDLNSIYVKTTVEGKKVVQVLPTLENAVKQTKNKILDKALNPLGPTPADPLRIGTLSKFQDRILTPGKKLSRRFIDNASDRFSLVSRSERETINDPGQIANLKAERFQTRLFAASALAGTASSFLPQNSAVGAGLTGTTVGAGTGAQIGSLAGPAGAAAGAVVGGLLGLSNSLNEFNKNKALKELELSANQLDDVLSRLAENNNVKNLQQAKNTILSDISQNQNFRRDEVSRGSSLPGQVLADAFGLAARDISFFQGKNKEQQELSRSSISENLKESGAISTVLETGFATLFGQGEKTLQDKLNAINTKQELGLRSNSQNLRPKLLDVATAEFKQTGQFDKNILKELAKTDEQFISAVKISQKVRGGTLLQNEDTVLEDTKFIETIIKRYEKLISSTKEYEDSILALEKRVKDSSLVFKTFADELSINIANISASAEAGLAGLSGIQSGNFSFASSRDFGQSTRQLDRIDTLSVAQLQKVGQDVNVESNPLAKQAFDQVQQFKIFDTKLREEIGKIDFAKFGDTENLSERLKASTGVKSEDAVGNAIIDNLAQELASRQKTFEGSGQKAQQFFDQTFTQRLDEGSKAAVEALKVFAKESESVSKILASFKDQRLSAARDVLSSTLNAREVEGGAAIQIADIQSGGGNVSSDILNRGFNSQLLELANTTDAADALEKFRISASEANQEILAGKIATEEEILGREKARKSAELLARDTTLAATALKKAGEAVGRQKAIVDFGQRVLQAGPEELMNLGVGFDVANQIQGGNLNAVNKENIKQFQAALPDITSNIAQFQGDKAAEDFKLKALEAQLNIGGLSPAEKAFVEQAKAAQKERQLQEEKAVNAINIQVDAANTLKAASESFKSSVDQLTRQKEKGLLDTLSPNVQQRRGSEELPDELFYPQNPQTNNSSIRRNANGMPILNPVASIGESFRKNAERSGINITEKDLSGFNNGIMKFGEAINQLANIKLPERITLEVAPIQTIVTFNGDGVLANAVAAQVKAQLENMVSEKIASIINVNNGQVGDGLA